MWDPNLYIYKSITNDPRSPYHSLLHFPTAHRSITRFSQHHTLPIPSTQSLHQVPPHSPGSSLQITTPTRSRRHTDSSITTARPSPTNLPKRTIRALLAPTGPRVTQRVVAAEIVALGRSNTNTIRIRRIAGDDVGSRTVGAATAGFKRGADAVAARAIRADNTAAAAVERVTGNVNAFLGAG